MPQCNLCNKFFFPTLMSKKKPVCTFCDLEKDELTIVDDETKQERILTKDVAVDEYRKFVNRLAAMDKEKKAAKKLVVGN